MYIRKLTEFSAKSENGCWIGTSDIPENLRKDINVFQIIDFIKRFENNGEIIDCICIFQDGTGLSSHDDGEVEFNFPRNSNYFSQIISGIILNIGFEPIDIFKTLSQNLNQYVLFQPPDKVKKVFQTFDDYIHWSRN